MVDKVRFLIRLFKLPSITLSWLITAIMFPSIVKLQYSNTPLAKEQSYITQFAEGIINLNHNNIRVMILRCIGAARSLSHVNNTLVLTILTFRHIQCLHLMHAEVAWVLVSSGNQVQPQITLDPDYLPDYISVSYDYGLTLDRAIDIFIVARFFTGDKS